MSCSHACGGKCCEDFVIFASPERIGELYLDAVARITAFEDIPNDWEAVTVAEMVVRIDEPDEARPRYTCKHYQPETGRCGAYERRPNMCRDYPYDHPCPGCGYTAPGVATITTANAGTGE